MTDQGTKAPIETVREEVRALARYVETDADELTTREQRALAALTTLEQRMRLLEFAESREYANAKRAEARIASLTEALEEIAYRKTSTQVPWYQEAARAIARAALKDDTPKGGQS